MNQARVESEREDGVKLILWYLKFAMESGATTWSMEQVTAKCVVDAVESFKRPGSAYRNRIAYTVIDMYDIGVAQRRKRLIAGSPHIIARIGRLETVHRSVRQHKYEGDREDGRCCQAARSNVESAFGDAALGAPLHTIRRGLGQLASFRVLWFVIFCPHWHHLTLAVERESEEGAKLTRHCARLYLLACALKLWRMLVAVFNLPSKR